MLQKIPIAVLLLALSPVVCGADAAQADSAALADRFEALVEEADQAGQPREFAHQFVDFAERHSDDPIAADALIWVVTNVRRGSDLSRSMELLSKDHIGNENLASLFKGLADNPTLIGERLMREALEKSPHKTVQAQACVHLTTHLKQQARLSASLKEQSDRRRFEQYYGREFARHLASLDEETVSEELERLYERILDSFYDVRTEEETLGEWARKSLFALRNLSLGKTAPEIAGEDIDGKPFKLSDYRGKVVVLDFWGHW